MSTIPAVNVSSRATSAFVFLSKNVGESCIDVAIRCAGVLHSCGEKWTAVLLLHGNQILVDRHSNHRIHANGIESVNFLLFADASSRNEPSGSLVAEIADDVEGESLKHSLSFDMRVQERAAVRFQSPNHVGSFNRSKLLPTLDGDMAGARVDGENQ